MTDTGAEITPDVDLSAVLQCDFEWANFKDQERVSGWFHCSDDASRRVRTTCICGVAAVAILCADHAEGIIIGRVAWHCLRCQRVSSATRRSMETL